MNKKHIAACKKSAIRFLIFMVFLSATITTVSMPIVYAPAEFTAVETLDLYDCVNEAKKSVIYGTDLYIATDEHHRKVTIQKIDLTTFTLTANISWATYQACDIQDMLVDSAGNYLYAAQDGNPSIIRKIDLNTFTLSDSLTLGSGDNDIEDQVIIGDCLYSIHNTVPTRIVKTNLTTFTRVSTLTLEATEYYGYRIVYEGSGDMMYATTASPYEAPYWAAGRVVQINVTSFTRNAAIQFTNAAECFPFGATIYGEYLYVTTWDDITPYVDSRVIRINLTSFSRDGYLDFIADGWQNARVREIAINGTHGFVHKGTSYHRLVRFDVATFSWVGSYLDWFTTEPSSFALSGGYLYQPNSEEWSTVYKLNMATFVVDDTLPLTAGVAADYIVGLESDTTYLYALCQMASGSSKIAKVDLATFGLVTTQALGATEDEAEGFELYNNYLYVGCDNGTGSKILKIDASSLATVDTLVLGAWNYTVHSLHVAEDGYLYAGVYTSGDEGNLFKLDPSNLDIISMMKLNTDETHPMAMASDGTYLYVAVETDYYFCQIPKIALANFSRVDYITLDTISPVACDYDDGYLYVSLYDYPTTISKIDVDTMTEVDYENLPVDEIGGFGLSIFLGYIYVGVDYDTPDGGTIVKLKASTLDRVDGLTLDYDNKETDIGDLEIATVGNDIFIFAGINDKAPAKIVQVYLTSTVDCTFVSNPEIKATFTVEGAQYTTPCLISPYKGVNTLYAAHEVEYEDSTYVFDTWLVNGTTYYYSLTLILDLVGETSFVINYVEKGSPPYIPLFDPEAINATWYMRSDTHTIHDNLGYKLHEYQSYTEVSDSRYSSSQTTSVSYGVRIWALDYKGDTSEISNGSPVAIVTRDDDAAGIISETWNCPKYLNIVDAVKVNVYQRFGTGAWSLRRIFISEEALLITFPKSTWTFYYYVEQIKGSTNSTFYHGSLSFNSRMTFQYYRISAFEKMTYHLQQFQLLSFVVTPWTYYIGNMFYGILLFFFGVTTYLRYHSLRAVLAVFWLFGGTGGLLSALMPAIGLQISWVILAFTFATTIFLLIYGRRT